MASGTRPGTDSARRVIASASSGSRIIGACAAAVASWRHGADMTSITASIRPAASNCRASSGTARVDDHVVAVLETVCAQHLHRGLARAGPTAADRNARAAQARRRRQASSPRARRRARAPGTAPPRARRCRSGPWLANAPCPVTAAAATSLCTSAKRASPESIMSALVTLPCVFACVTDHAAPRGRSDSTKRAYSPPAGPVATTKPCSPLIEPQLDVLQRLVEFLGNDRVVRVAQSWRRVDDAGESLDEVARFDGDPSQPRASPWPAAATTPATQSPSRR